ncbi:uncharacterized protein N7473_011075 [Penicillium subrubescens]|uniref:uncharacterized protein n=1 Tax=Penicillium subrubescens TaxID=1316194 RepID=UPI002544F31D|nr:uncharacterized protein N7473_011075 [Penicillium subrubescens]KAJ5882813.1 hypothetical protein N7473_011075 [Penicillium subrubescens]
MALSPNPGPAEKAIRKLDITHVSLSLQLRLGLAKLKYQHGRLHRLMLTQDGGDKPSESSSDFSRSRRETPMTSPALRAGTYSKELPRSAHNKDAVTFNSHITQPMHSASRKRVRYDPDTERPAKAARPSGKSPHQLPTSSAGLNFHMTTRRHPRPFMYDAIIPELSSPVYQSICDKENHPDLPRHSFRHVSYMWGSSPPRTPPRRAHLARSGRPSQHEDGADLPLYLAKSPTPAREAGVSHRALPTSTPPSQHAILPMLATRLGTPDQRFSFADFVNVTPSPAQSAWGGRTPGNLGRSPLSTEGAHKQMNFDALLQPSLAPEGARLGWLVN